MKTGEWARTGICVKLLTKGARHDDGAIGAGGGNRTARAWVEAHTGDRALVQWLAKRRLFGLREGDPEV